ncbi:diaminopropionate ammonia-lyase [Steroidobacter sp.]|uniref:diaminopropionate ammonia-lyase n=1 Tax=Steroidobacter sp. TaxID=1978227 RepID=UPI001A583E10|nr:diaminopropionate ammonia-lyase [Steroidobacter sp.]MBL8271400.1 diaminopropionate ammonia-lyase [Steroidobacter sp.]
MLSINQLPQYGLALDAEDAVHVDLEAARQVEQLLRHCPAYRTTPLHSLPRLAAELGLRGILVKDESTRLGLGSFKALGGAYAVIRTVIVEASRALKRQIEPKNLLDAPVRSIAASLTFACATDGNHGKSVAAGARMLGARAVIFVHQGVSAERVDAIKALGAEVRRVVGTYDDSVAEAARACSANGWAAISDTSWPGYTTVPRWVAQGYTAMVREVCNELRDPPTHVFVQAGVGGLAAAVLGHLALTLERRPRFVIVEPERAACLHASSLAGHRVAIAPAEPTVMSMLECYEPSLVAWSVIAKLADAFLTVSESDGIRAMRQFARPVQGDTPIVAGESGGAGLAGLLSVVANRVDRQALGLDRESVVLLFNTEGATDDSVYRSLLGIGPDEVRSCIRAGISSKKDHAGSVDQ